MPAHFPYAYNLGFDQESEDVRIEDVTILNAPLWNIRLQDWDRVWLRGIHLYSDLERGVNSDGIDIVSSSNVTISDSIIVTADDSICLKPEVLDPSPGRPVRPVENVLVTNSILGSSSTPMMMGAETHADIRHVVFSNIVVRDSNKVFGINVQDGGTVSDVRFVLWAEWLQKVVLASVPHRHVVFTMPRLLRGIFRKRRELLLDLAQCCAQAR